MNPTVYLETTIIGYLAMQPSGVLWIAANQQTTHEWWNEHRHRFAIYVSRFVVGECSAGDAAAAAVNGVEYLLTWNCRHIANPALRPRIESICRKMGYEPPVICTPQELLEIDDGA